MALRYLIRFTFATLGSTFASLFIFYTLVGMSCLFNSLGRLLSKDPQALRHEICNYLEAGSPIMDGMATADVLALESGLAAGPYIARMRKPQTWGGAIEIQAGAVLHSVRIIVKNLRNRGQKDMEFLPLSGTVTLTLTISWNGGHYEPISKS
jgi:hypothetical protein